MSEPRDLAKEVEAIQARDALSGDVETRFRDGAYICNQPTRDRRLLLAHIAAQARELEQAKAECDRLRARVAELEQSFSCATQSAVDQAAQCLLLREALRWALDNVVESGGPAGDNFQSHRVGLVSETIEPPAHLRPVLESVMGEQK